MNTPVQGLAADCLKLAMGRLVKTLADKPYIRPVMTVHDSLVFEVRADHVDEAVALVKGCMEALPPLENFMPLDALIASFAEFIPFIHTKLDVVLLNAIPFNLLKGLGISIVTLAVFPKLTPVLRGKGR